MLDYVSTKLSLSLTDFSELHVFLFVALDLYCHKRLRLQFARNGLAVYNFGQLFWFVIITCKEKNIFCILFCRILRFYTILPSQYTTKIAPRVFAKFMADAMSPVNHFMMQLISLREFHNWFTKYLLIFQAIIRRNISSDNLNLYFQNI